MDKGMSAAAAAAAFSGGPALELPEARRKSLGGFTTPRPRAGTGGSLVSDSSKRGPGCPPPRMMANPRPSLSPPRSSRSSSLGRRPERSRPTAPGVPSPFSCRGNPSKVGAPIDMPRKSVLARLEVASRGCSASTAAAMEQSRSRSPSHDAQRRPRSPSRLSSVGYYGSSVQVSANGCSIVSSVAQSDASIPMRRVHSLSLLPSQAVLTSCASQLLSGTEAVASPVGSRIASPVGSQAHLLASPVASQSGILSPRLQYMQNHVPIYQPGHMVQHQQAGQVARTLPNQRQQPAYPRQVIVRQMPMQQLRHQPQPPPAVPAARLLISQAIAAGAR